MEKQKKSYGTIALVVLLLIVTVVSIVLATYAWAKYTTTLPSTSATAQVAKWDVTLDPNTGTFIQSSSHVATDRIAPGSSGSFIVNINPGNTEVCFDYTISVDSIDFLDANNKVINPDTEIYNDGAQTNPKVYTIDDLKDHIEISYQAEGTTKQTITPGTGPIITGYYDATANPAAFSGKKTISWEWKYSGDGDHDLIDTAAGEYANSHDAGLKLRINYTVRATQVNPTGNHGTAN